MLIKHIVIVCRIAIVSFLCSCCSDDRYLEYALKTAGSNRTQLEYVLDYYKNDSEKLAAAKFLIENMPAHHSFQSPVINDYYDIAKSLLYSSLSPIEQRDSLSKLSKGKFGNLMFHTIPDTRIIDSEYLIGNIEKAYYLWKNKQWASHLTFDEFCEWLLPYKVEELQPLDEWRDTLSSTFSAILDNMVKDDDRYGTVFYSIDAVRKAIIEQVHPLGMYRESGYPLLRSDLLLHQTYGRCEDYVNLAVMTYRSLGLPVVIDETPCWGRYRAGHSWYTLLSDRGEHLSAEWDVGSVPGTAFFPEQRIPKVYRRLYSINRKRTEYYINSKYKYPFDLCEADVTTEYVNTSNVDIKINNDNLVEDYAYIAVFNGHNEIWSIVDYGVVENNIAHFCDMGRNILYICLGFDGERLNPISPPFIIERNGCIKNVMADSLSQRTVCLRRKYYQSNNVLIMRNRIKNAQIQASNTITFKNAEIVYTIDSVAIPDRIPTNETHPYRYWRYISADGTYGSIAELAFFSNDTTVIQGEAISTPNIDKSIVDNAYDGDWLTNFESDNPDGIWIGMDFGKPTSVNQVRVIPRSDDNDIHPGDLYELRYWSDNGRWEVLGIKEAAVNSLVFDNVPKGALLWLHDYTRGWDERPFLIDDNGNVEWW